MTEIDEAMARAVDIGENDVRDSCISPFFNFSHSLRFSIKYSGLNSYNRMKEKRARLRLRLKRMRKLHATGVF